MKLALFIAVVLSFLISSCTTEEVKEQEVMKKKSEFLYEINIDSLDVERDTILNNQSLSDILGHHGISVNDIDKIVKKSEGIFDLRKMRAGNPYVLLCARDSAKTVKYFIYEHNPIEYLVFDFTDSIKVYKGEKEVTVKVKTLYGEIESSLWNAMTDRGYDPMLSNALSDIYAWSIDFFGLQVGDKFKMIYEEQFVDTVSVGFGKIHAAWFYHMDSAYYAIPFFQDSVESYYDIAGNSLRKAFLKAPLSFSRISSHFSNSRLHPILKIYRPHHGVDYSAPSGTPVMSIGDGKVLSAGYSGGAGRMVKIRHNSNYETVYMHLSGFADGIKAGAMVKQGDVIGYVGSSGLSTGPHLDLRFYKNGQPIDPLKVEAPPVEPVKKELFDKYTVIRDSLVSKLDGIKAVNPKKTEKK